MIFNVEKTAEQYENVTLFGNGDVGLLDTVNKKFEEIFKLYKEMKALDWDELEFDFSQCLVDFEKAPKDVTEMMIKTIMWQWESDSVASQCPVVIIAPYEPCTELWEAELRINDNESVHANTYSEIVRMGFPVPQDVLRNMLQKTEAHKRLDVVGTTLKEIKQNSIMLAMDKEFHGRVVREDDYLQDMILFYFTMLCLERVQFMDSFGTTFIIAQSGWYQAVGQAVKKICQDEFEVHSEYRKEVLNQLISTDKGKVVFEQLKPKLVNILEEVVDSEIRWTVEDLFENDKKSLVGTNSKLMTQWCLFNAKAVANSFGLKTKYTFPKTNPMPILEDWINMNKQQSAPQEADNPAYKVNAVEVDDEDATLTFVGEKPDAGDQGNGLVLLGLDSGDGRCDTLLLLRVIAARHGGGRFLFGRDAERLKGIACGRGRGVQPGGVLPDSVRACNACVLSENPSDERQDFARRRVRWENGRLRGSVGEDGHPPAGLNELRKLSLQEGTKQEQGKQTVVDGEGKQGDRVRVVHPTNARHRADDRGIGTADKLGRPERAEIPAARSPQELGSGGDDLGDGGKVHEDGGDGDLLRAHAALSVSPAFSTSILMHVSSR